MIAFAATIFLGAFLLFQVQPIIGKYILPWFGGGPGVWTTCMLFFQVALLGGYGYAHWLAKRFRTRTQVLVHSALALGALCVLPIIPSDSWKPHSAKPVADILLLLAANVGIPYVILSGTGPLVQEWFSRTNRGRNPYRLYALSNLGSLLALLSYPFYFESHFTRRTQAAFWGWGLVAYAVACAACVWRVMRAGDLAAAAKGEGPPEAPLTSSEPGKALRITPLRRGMWLLLPACASVLLLATTNKLCQDVAVMPFLWILPLCIYLLSFIICFDQPRLYPRLPFALLLITALGGTVWTMYQGTDLSIQRQLVYYSLGLFVCCMVCHGELYRLRPGAERLTEFYLMVAAGGALGAVFVGVLAPVLFTDYYEFHFGLVACGGLFVLACALDTNPSAREWRWLGSLLPLLAFGGLDRAMVLLSGESSVSKQHYILGLRITIWVALGLLVFSWVSRGKYRRFRFWRAMTCCWLTLGVFGLAVALWLKGRDTISEIVSRTRNFYGVLTVYEHNKAEPKQHHFLLQHGRITHGLQFTDPVQARWPTTYYADTSGVGLAINALPNRPRRLGVVGLGTGSLTTYGRPGDSIRIYDIDPQVKELATSRFSYLSNCPAKVEVVLGDARLSMEREPPQNLDLLALDAFSGDAIPAHLLTREAFQIYERHLNTNGVIAVHISNQYLDLEPVVMNLALAFNYKIAVIDYDEDQGDWWLYSSTWVLLSRNADLMGSPLIAAAGSGAPARSRIPLWTDDFSSLFQILK